MIYIFTALYPEAQPLIRLLGLRKRAEQTHYQQFVSEDPACVLSLTGVGPMNAAITAAAVLSEYAAGPGDQLLSFGTAAMVGPEEPVRQKQGPAGIERKKNAAAEDTTSGGMYHIHRITDLLCDRDFYPDMLLRTGLPEAALRTGAQLLSADMRSEAAPFLYDMEGAAIYQAAAMFLGPHQMNFVRVVTDHGLTEAQISDPRQLSGHVTACIERQEDALHTLLDRLFAWSAAEAAERSEAQALTGEELRLVERLSEDAHFSDTMETELRQLLRYAALSRMDWHTALQRLYDEGLLPVRDKRAGKQILTRLRQVLLS